MKETNNFHQIIVQAYLVRIRSAQRREEARHLRPRRRASAKRGRHVRELIRLADGHLRDVLRRWCRRSSRPTREQGQGRDPPARRVTRGHVQRNDTQTRTPKERHLR